MTIEMKVPAHSDRRVTYDEVSTVYEDKKKSSIFAFAYTTQDVIVESKKELKEEVEVIEEKTKAAETVAGHQSSTSNSTTIEPPQITSPRFAAMVSSHVEKANLESENKEPMQGATPDLAKIIHSCCDGRKVGLGHIQAALGAGMSASAVMGMARTNPMHLRSFAENTELDKTSLICEAFGWELLEKEADGLPSYVVLDESDIIAECSSLTKDGAKKVLERKIDFVLNEMVEMILAMEEAKQNQPEPVTVETVKSAIKSIIADK